MAISKKKFDDTLHDLLWQYEKATAELEKFEADNRITLEKYNYCKDAVNAAEESVKRLVHKNKVPWGGPDTRARQITLCELGAYKVQATYKLGSDWYDPKKLPAKLFTTGTVLKVDTKEIDVLLGTKPKREAELVRAEALVKGEWLTPSVSFLKVT